MNFRVELDAIQIAVLVPASFKEVPYRTVSLLKSTLNDTNQCKVTVITQ